MMKLIIQIPCFNEENSLPVTLANLPRQVEGFDRVEWLIINDGSSDRTLQVAREQGVDHIVDLVTRRGLSKAFMAGLDACLERGADVIVNTDADNQYNAADIPALVAPVLDGRADIVIGARPIADIEHFSSVKKALQMFGSWVVRAASGTSVPDVPSGFRAFSREAALRINVFNPYTYTLETVIQAGHTGLRIASVAVRVNEELRPSRLIRSMPSYVYRSTLTLVRIFMLYQPFRFFASIGSTLLLIALLIGLRFLYHFLTDSGSGRIQSLILAAILAGAGTISFMTAWLADLLAINRRLLEEIRYRTRKAEINRNKS